MTNLVFAIQQTGACVAIQQTGVRTRATINILILLIVSHFCQKTFLNDDVPLLTAYICDTACATVVFTDQANPYLSGYDTGAVQPDKL